MFERCCRPLIPSATIAERSAKLAAHGSAERTSTPSMAGSAGIGSTRGRSPKREPIVSTGSARSAVARLAVTTAMTDTGQPDRQRPSPAVKAPTGAPIC